MAGDIWDDFFAPKATASLAALIQSDIDEEVKRIEEEEKAEKTRQAKKAKQAKKTRQANTPKQAKPAKPVQQAKKPETPEGPEKAVAKQAKAQVSQRAKRRAPREAKPRPAITVDSDGIQHLRAISGRPVEVNPADVQRAEAGHDSLSRFHTQPHPWHGRMVRLKHNLPYLDRELQDFFWQPQMQPEFDPEDEPVLTIQINEGDQDLSDYHSLAGGQGHQMHLEPQDSAVAPLGPGQPVMGPCKTLADLHCVVDDWFDHKFECSPWRPYKKNERGIRELAKLDQYDLPHIYFLVRISKLPDRGPNDRWMNNDVVCVKTDYGMPLIVLASEIAGLIDTTPEA